MAERSSDMTARQTLLLPEMVPPPQLLSVDIEAIRDAVAAEMGIPKRYLVGDPETKETDHYAF